MRTSSPSGAAVRPLRTPSNVPLQQLSGGVAARTLQRAARPELSAVLTREPGLQQVGGSQERRLLKADAADVRVRSAGENRA